MMVTLNEKNLLVAKASSKGGIRGHLERVHIEPDGSTIGTDGRRLAKVSAETDPYIPDGFTHQDSDEGFSIPREVAEEMARDLKNQRKSLMPGTDKILYTGKNEGKREFVRPDTLGERVYRITEIEDKFPPHHEVIDIDQDYCEISVNANLLKDLAQMALDFLRGEFSEKDKKFPSITLHVPITDSLKQIKAVCHSKETGQTLEYILMPLRK